mmetsp:Transcript_30574/g.55839  ORF Transcript_30574/g.55839 Transcript_30574/m.55839 type:complete len:368 (+) Transcript_30574:85-1188(+)
MKLKKFLLRYEPPGVGLEVEHADGDIDVRHKDLPSTNGNWSGRDIYGLVDGLIEEESDILSRRKHRAALVGLLSRLYKVEVGPEDDEDGEDDRPVAADKKPADDRNHGGKNADSSGIYEGQQIVLVRLVGKQQVYNGEVAEVTKAKGDKGKFEVQLKSPKGNEGESKLKIKGIEHLIPLLTSDKASLEVNVLVCIRGLRNHIELNGCLGRIQQCHVDSHRYEVRALESGQLFRVKQENLLLIENCPQLGPMKENKDPNMQAAAAGGGEGGGQEQSNQAPIGDMGIDGEVLEPGSIIQLHGLKSAMQFNGQAAEVLSIDRVRGRYEIQLNDGSVKTVRAENVKLISRPTKPSPRGKARSGTGAAGKKA